MKRILAATFAILCALHAPAVAQLTASCGANIPTAGQIIVYTPVNPQTGISYSLDGAKDAGSLVTRTNPSAMTDLLPSKPTPCNSYTVKVLPGSVGSDTVSTQDSATIDGQAGVTTQIVVPGQSITFVYGAANWFTEIGQAPVVTPPPQISVSMISFSGASVAPSVATTRGPGGAGFAGVFPFNGTIKNFYAGQVAAANSVSPVYTLYTGATQNMQSATALTCSVANAAVSCKDLTHTAAVTAGTYFQVFVSNPTGATTTGSLAFGFEVTVP